MTETGSGAAQAEDSPHFVAVELAEAEDPRPTTEVWPGHCLMEPNLAQQTALARSRRCFPSVNFTCRRGLVTMDRTAGMLDNASMFIARLLVSRFSHALGLLSSKQAHDKPVKSIALMKEGPRILTGSTDSTIKVMHSLILMHSDGG